MKSPQNIDLLLNNFAIYKTKLLTRTIRNFNTIEEKLFWFEIQINISSVLSTKVSRVPMFQTSEAMAPTRPYKRHQRVSCFGLFKLQKKILLPNLLELVVTPYKNYKMGYKKFIIVFSKMNKSTRFRTPRAQV